MRSGIEQGREKGGADDEGNLCEGREKSEHKIWGDLCIKQFF